MIEFIDLKAQQSRIKAEIDAGIQRVLAHGQYILGPEVAELEEKLAAYVGAKYCITCANGTDALQIVQINYIHLLNHSGLLNLPTIETFQNHPLTKVYIFYSSFFSPRYANSFIS